MEVIREIKNTINEKRADLKFELPEKCPICNANIVASDICGSVFRHNNDLQAVMLNYCSGCQSCFMSTYQVETVDRGKANTISFNSTRFISSEPARFIPEKFSRNLNNMSPLFIEIFNQAKQAEVHHMNHIAGIGYRKALEFLIKDYSIHFNNNEADAIKTMPLVQCIKTYIESHKIKTLAEKSAWLGNDEVHYIRKHADKDVEDLKRFISACVSYIDMELTLEEAEAIQKA